MKMYLSPKQWFFADKNNYSDFQIHIELKLSHLLHSNVASSFERESVKFPFH